MCQATRYFIHTSRNFIFDPLIIISFCCITISLPKIESPYTIVAGTGGLRGFWSPFGDELNDGIVALNETRLSHQDQIIQLPVFHTFMMNDPIVQKTVKNAFSQTD